MPENEKKTSSKKSPRLPAAVLIVLAAVILFFSLVLFAVWLKVGQELPLWLLPVLLIAPAAVLIGSVIGICKRFQSIKGGEDDETAEH